MSTASNGLPPGWAEAAVGEIGSVRLGRQRSPKNRSNEHPTPYLRAANITWDGLDLSDVLDMEFRPDEREVHRLVPGDVVLAEASGSSSEVGKPAIWRGEIKDCCIQNTVIRFRPRCVTSEYSRLLFLHYAKSGRFAQISKGVGIHHLSAERFATLSVPVAPLPEQRRIVAEIEKQFSRLDAGVAALKRVAANLKRYKAAVLKAACDGSLTADWRAAHPDAEPAGVLLRRILAERRRRWEQAELARMAARGKPPTDDRWKSRYAEPQPPNPADLPPLPKTWTWATVEQLTPFDRPTAYGVLQPGDDVESGVEFVRVCDIREGSVLRDQLKRIAPKIAAAYPRTRLQGGEVLLTIVGTIGRSAVAPPELAGANTARAVAMIPVAPPFLARYVEICFRNPAKAAELVGKSHEVARKTLNLEDVRAACVPLPPVDEQAAIVEAVEDAWSIIQAVATAADSNARRASHLRQAILREAFAGKLVPQDPADEPAAALLERIRAREKPAAPPRLSRPRRQGVRLRPEGG